MAKDTKEKAPEIFNLNLKNDSINKLLCDHFNEALTVEDVKKSLKDKAPSDSIIKIWISDLSKTFRYLEEKGHLK